MQISEATCHPESSGCQVCLLAFFLLALGESSGSFFFLLARVSLRTLPPSTLSRSLQSIGSTRVGVAEDREAVEVFLLCSFYLHAL